MIQAKRHKTTRTKNPSNYVSTHAAFDVGFINFTNKTLYVTNGIISLEINKDLGRYNGTNEVEDNSLLVTNRVFDGENGKRLFNFMTKEEQFDKEPITRAFLITNEELDSDDIYIAELGLLISKSRNDLIKKHPKSDYNIEKKVESKIINKNDSPIKFRANDPYGRVTGLYFNFNDLITYGSVTNERHLEEECVIYVRQPDLSYISYEIDLESVLNNITLHTLKESNCDIFISSSLQEISRALYERKINVKVEKSKVVIDKKVSELEEIIETKSATIDRLETNISEKNEEISKLKKINKEHEEKEESRKKREHDEYKIQAEEITRKHDTLVQILKTLAICVPAVVTVLTFLNKKDSK